MSEYEKQYLQDNWYLHAPGRIYSSKKGYLATTDIIGASKEDIYANGCRIVACVNAFAKIEDSVIDDIQNRGGVPGLMARGMSNAFKNIELEQQRDALLAALKSTMNMLDEFSYQRILRGEDKHKILKLIAEIESNSKEIA